MSDGVMYCILECFGGPRDGERHFLMVGAPTFDPSYYFGVHPTSGEPCWRWSQDSARTLSSEG